MLEEIMQRRGLKRLALAIALQADPANLSKKIRKDEDIMLTTWLDWCERLGVNPATGADLQPGETVGIRPVGASEFIPFTHATVEALKQGDYELKDSTGEIRHVTLRISLGLPALVIHSAGERQSKKKKHA